MQTLFLYPCTSVNMWDILHGNLPALGKISVLAEYLLGRIWIQQKSNVDMEPKMSLAERMKTLKDKEEQWKSKGKGAANDSVQFTVAGRMAKKGRAFLNVFICCTAVSVSDLPKPGRHLMSSFRYNNLLCKHLWRKNANNTLQKTFRKRNKSSAETPIQTKIQRKAAYNLSYCNHQLAQAANTVALWKTGKEITSMLCGSRSRVQGRATYHHSEEVQRHACETTWRYCLGFNCNAFVS